MLTKEEIQLIHDKTLNLLEEIGVKVESPEARAFLEEHGCEMEKCTHFVKFPNVFIKRQLKDVPESFSLWGSDGTFQLNIDTKKVNFATVDTPIKIFLEFKNKIKKK
ncbi:MAG: trimethylamine methyltransferase family protein [Promethearchaeota archaeon]